MSEEKDHLEKAYEHLEQAAEELRLHSLAQGRKVRASLLQDIVNKKFIIALMMTDVGAAEYTN